MNLAASAASARRCRRDVDLAHSVVVVEQPVSSRMLDALRLRTVLPKTLWRKCIRTDAEVSTKRSGVPAAPLAQVASARTRRDRRGPTRGMEGVEVGTGARSRGKLDQGGSPREFVHPAGITPVPTSAFDERHSPSPATAKSTWGPQQPFVKNGGVRPSGDHHRVRAVLRAAGGARSRPAPGC